MKLVECEHGSKLKISKHGTGINQHYIVLGKCKHGCHRENQPFIGSMYRSFNKYSVQMSNYGHFDNVIEIWDKDGNTPKDMKQIVKRIREMLNAECPHRSTETNSLFRTEVYSSKNWKMCPIDGTPIDRKTIKKPKGGK